MVESSGTKQQDDGASTSASSVVSVQTVREKIRWKPMNPFKRVIFLDIDRLVWAGYRARLEPDEMYPEPSLSTPFLMSNFMPAWQRQLEKRKPDLQRAILAGNVKLILISAVLYGISQACSLAGPLLLQRIVAGLACQPYIGLVPGLNCETKSTLYYYCIGLFLAPLIQSLCDNQQTFLLYLAGTRMRNSLMATIYRKCLRLSNSAMQAESTGRVVTLMSNDAQKLQDAMFAINSLWGAPAIIIAVLILLWFQVGWATFVGLGIMLLLTPTTGLLATKLGGLRREIMQWTDKRVGLMNECINGIQMIKFYAWENAFTKKVMFARNNEARILRLSAAWQGSFGVIVFAGPVLVAIFCFGSWSLAGHQLTPAKAYAALAYFSLLRFPMSFLPMMITMIINALVALKRIQGFLERSEATLAQSEAEGQKSVERGGVKVESGEFVWDEKAIAPTLQNISFEAKPGTLTMIVGSVGSGKSSMLGALVGHISRRAGSVQVNGNIAYVAQTAWIMNDTLQENVLLGSDLEPTRYQMALETAQLLPDIDILPNGDITEIGDRGITLSGGQKQRVSIARAVYADADVYLLDDPLSAVDSHVGRALFEQCIRGPLRNKTVILVTNALQYLPHADNILWMHEGTIKAQGTYSELVAQGLNIAELAHIEDEQKKASDEEVVDAAAAAAGKEAHKPLLHKSVVSRKLTLTRQAADANRNLTGIEAREEGNVSWSVVKAYLQSGGGLAVFIMLLTLFGLEQGARVYTDRWIGLWASNVYDKGVWFYLGIYFALGVFFALLTYARSINFMFMCVRAAVAIHNSLLHHILRLPKSFFDTNPAGRILNRFSRDTDIMDSTLSQSLSQLSVCIATYIAVLVVICIATKWFTIALLPLTLIYFGIQRYYVPTARELQRIEGITRSPIYSKFSEALQGIPTIRAYRKEEHFTKVSDGLMEHNAQAFITQKLASAWLASRLDLMGLLILTGTGVLCIAGNIDPTLAGLALMYALDLTRYLKQGTNMAAKSESDFNSVERIVQYLSPKPEADPDTRPEVAAAMDPKWPSKGAITVTKLFMRYRPEMPLVLKGVSFAVHPGEKVGLVGRTGSGKSSLLLALFRMVEAESGSIVIDGVDIATLGVRHLRSKMSIIPQEPFLFSGTVRNNLDPFDNHKDDELWRVLEFVGLKPVVSGFDKKLEATVVDNGANFSLGQRQLFCLARAMLRNSRILMLDEATASVDLDTDNLLQSAIRTSFADCTMLTIAHRLNTIMDSDRVIVLDHGQVVENDDPETLLQKDQGMFSSMVQQTGASSARFLKGLASSAKYERNNSVLQSLTSFDRHGPGGASFKALDSAPPSGMPTPSGSFNSKSAITDLTVYAEASSTPRHGHAGELHSALARLETMAEGDEQLTSTHQGLEQVAVEVAAAVAAAAAAPAAAGAAGAAAVMDTMEDAHIEVLEELETVASSSNRSSHKRV